MPCTFVKKQSVISTITGRRHIITGIRREKKKAMGGWGSHTVTDVFINVDHQRDGNGQRIWQGWGCFKAIA